MRTLIAFLILSAPSLAGTYVVESYRPCNTNRCQILPASSTCFAIARTPTGATICLTAGHCVESGETAYVVSPDGRWRATVATRHPNQDLMALIVQKRLRIKARPGPPPADGAEAIAQGVISRRPQRSTIRIKQTRNGRLSFKGWMSSGMSGGPVLDKRGQLVGILTGRSIDGYGHNVTAGEENYAVAGEAINSVLAECERRYGTLIYAPSVTVTPSPENSPTLDAAAVKRIEGSLAELTAFLTQSQQETRSELNLIKVDVSDLQSREAALQRQIDDLTARLRVVETRKRTVILSADGKEVDREEYGPNEAIEFDVQALKVKQ